MLDLLLVAQKVLRDGDHFVEFRRSGINNRQFSFARSLGVILRFAVP